MTIKLQNYKPPTNQIQYISHKLISMLLIYDQSKQQLYDKSILHLDKVSVGLNGSRVLVVQSSSDFTIKSPSDTVKLAQLTGVDQVNLFSQLTYTPTGTYTPVYLNLYSDNELDTTVDLHITNTEGLTITLSVVTTFEDNSDRLMVLLNNNGVRISDTWYKAIKSSDINEVSAIVLNQKRREFLLNLLTLTGCIGGYNNMFAALDFFEWSDIVTIYEYWKDGKFDKYRLTDTTNKLLNKELLNDGFVKTNWLGLYFQLNVPDGTFDDDGFANFTNVNIAIADLWMKLYYLKQILEETFLPTNVKFIDIVGEYNAIAGIDSKNWVDKSIVTNIEPNPKQVFGNFQIKGSTKKRIVIEDSYCLRKLPLYVDVDDTIKLDHDAPSSHPTEPIFKIHKTKEELATYVVQDFEILTQFYRGDFASIEITFDVINPDLASTLNYKVGLQIYNPTTDTYDVIYLSDLLSFNEFLQSYKLGCRRTGKFRLAIYVFDGFGSMDMISTELTFDVVLDSLDIQLYEISDNLQNALVYDNSFYTTIPTIQTELVVPDAFDSSFNIKDRSTAVAGRYYKNHMTDRMLETTINQYNMVENRQLKKARIIDYATYHDVVLLRFGTNTTNLQMKLYPRHEYTTVTGASGTDIEKQAIVSQLNQISIHNDDWKNPFNRYTYQLVEYSLDGTMTNVEKVIMAFSKEADRFYDRIIHNLDSTPVQTAKIRLLALNHAFIRVTKVVNPGVTGDIVVTIGKDIFHTPNVTVNTMQDIVTAIGDIEGLSLTVSPINMLMVSCASDISIQHPAIGMHYDIVRNVAYRHIKTAKIGQDFQITIPVFAQPQKRYNTYDYIWTVIDHYSGDVVHTENNQIMSWLPFNIGIFDIKLEMLDGLNNNSLISVQKRGGVRIADIPFSESGEGLTYYNVEVSVVVYNTTCGTGFHPTPLTYTVPARTYFSTFSQEEADLLAQDEISDKSQKWADEFGYCVLND